jgi:hypothetical protein
VELSSVRLLPEAESAWFPEKIAAI